MALPEPGLALISPTWALPALADPHQRGSAPLCQTFSDWLSLAECRLHWPSSSSREKRGGWTLGTAGIYTSLNCLFIKMTVRMKKSFLLPCFHSPALSLSPYASSFSLIHLRSRSEQSFGSLRWRGVRLKWRFVLLCVCVCVWQTQRDRKCTSWREGFTELVEIDDKRRDGHCEVMTLVVQRFSEMYKGNALFWQMKQCLYQVINQSRSLHQGGK